MYTHSRVISTLLVTAALGCNASNDPVDLGDNQATPTGAALSDYSGEWEGYVEAFEFADGSDAVRLTLDEQGSGSFVVGDTPLRPTPGVEDGFAPWEWYEHGTEVLLPGFAYPVEGASVEGGRLRVALSASEIYADWCTLHEPIRNGSTSDPTTPTTVGDLYGCVPEQYTGPDANGMCSGVGPDGQVTASCGKFECLKVCECTETSCAASTCPEPSDSCGDLDLLDNDMQLDAKLDAEGSELRGTLLISVPVSRGVPRTVVMTRL